MDRTYFWPWKRKARRLVSNLRWAAVVAFALYVFTAAFVGDNVDVWISWRLNAKAPTFRADAFQSLRSDALGVGRGIGLEMQPEENARGRNLLDGVVENALKLRLIHRNHPDSPFYVNNYGFGVKELEEILSLDAARVRGFSLSLRSMRDRAYFNQLAAYGSGDPRMEPAASPETNPPGAESPQQPWRPIDLESPLISGSSLGNIGQYFVEIFVGTPGHRFLFIADTGSDLIWLPCYPCSTCSPDFRPIFFPRNSSSFTPISCSSDECSLVPAPDGATCNPQLPSGCFYEYIYGDLSQTRGTFVYDTVTMSSSAGREVKLEKVAFGCGMNNTGSSMTIFGGVLGLGQGAISFSSQIGYMYGSKFSYCLESFYNPRPAASSLVFGERSTIAYIQEAVQYTPILKNPLSETYYYVGIEDVTVGGEPLPIPPSVWEIDLDGNGGTVIDSGTTLSFFLQPAYVLILGAFQRAISYPRAPPTSSLDLCYNVSGITNPSFPQLAISFRGNAVFQPPDENYFLTTAPDTMCLSFQGNSSPDGMSVLGNVLQQNFHVEYDRGRNRLGFARADCSVQT